ncbi:MAG TPA: M28 family peptidase [Acidobacteriaceae bacterium]|nr:M28 family peptidase [Acidobacteriaceae bacterium]
MPIRVPTTAVLLLLIAPAIPGQTDRATETVAKSAATTPAAKPADPPAPDVRLAGTEAAKPADAVAKSRTLFFYTSPRSTVEMAVHSIPETNQQRLDRLRENFKAADCNGSRMQEQPIPAKGEQGTNLICTWPGATRGTIVIVAHYEHEGKGEGALADWSGAVLLPFLYEAIQGQPRENNYVFLEAWKRAGAEVWLKSLPKAERKNIRAVIDVDALGLGSTRFYTTFSPFETAPPGSAHLQTQLLWAAIDEGLTQPPEQTSTRHWLSVDDTDPFRAETIPTIVIHSVPPQSDHVPGSAADVASALDGNAYFQSYHLMCAYLASLDRVAAKLDTQDRMWDANAPVDVQPESETPRVTFRSVYGGRLGATKPQ